MPSLSVDWDYDEHGTIGYRWRIDSPPTRGGLAFADREQALAAGRTFADWLRLLVDDEQDAAHA